MKNLMMELFHLFSKLFHHKTDPVLNIKNQCLENAVILNYWQNLKINSQGILVKQINTTEQIVLPLKNIVISSVKNSMKIWVISNVRE